MMQGSLLLDAIFKHFWPAEKKLISRRALTPFLALFIIANFYYVQCLLIDESQVQGVWDIIMQIYAYFVNERQEDMNWTNGQIYKEFYVEPVLWGLFVWFLI